MDYQVSGVNIDAGNAAVDLIKDKVASTHNASVLQSIGGFAAMVDMPQGFREPVLVSCTDGVGTKLRLAIAWNGLNRIGQDLVAMCVNDLICCGATPLFFLDYIACHELVPADMSQLVSGIADACLLANCPLVGGEMAEMRIVYQKGDYDMAGFCVGVAEKSALITGDGVVAGDRVFALQSSGPHSNGYSLINHILTQTSVEAMGLRQEDLLAPTKIYVNDVLSLLKGGANIRAIAHITGGGIGENLSRVLPEGRRATILRSDLPTLDVFSKLQKAGGVADDEMYRVFNMGVGLIVISPDDLTGHGFLEIGQIVDGDRGVDVV